ncbi:hypothetical protein LSCM1_03793 [Leishmania martiniquensis]|uniref:TOG domain-containing protein n=1 Tax=Leishmania martiniquensis TaxID=1580590 RepID=A0A836GF40_9TRYP|nr:hypothetical protein LSCM1_03793 [Leishmania martiniquensis]
MSLDDQPIGEGGAPKSFGESSGTAEDFSSCSVSEALSHSNWKARKDGYERIQRDPIKHKKLLLDNIKHITNEGNATVQEAAIEALVAVLSECNDAERCQLAEAALPIVVEKGITGRPKAVQLSQQFIYTLVEEGCGAVVFAALLPSMKHKTPKNRLATAQTVAALVSEYGVQHFPLKEILKAMQPLFNDANAQVRKEAIALCCQCYRYIGASIKAFLTDLRDVQLQEVQKQFQSLKVGERPPKTIKGAVASSGDIKGGKTSLTAAHPIRSLTGDDTVAVDDAGFELLEESAVIPRLPKNFFRVALDKEKTWQERVEYVSEHLLPLLAAPRFRSKDNYHELASMVKEYLVDPQAPLMLLGFKMVQDCARGLRSDFGPYARLYISPLLDKMKDKKVSVQLHVMKTLEDLICFNCISMDQCNDDFEQTLQSKNPTQRTVLLNYLIRMVDTLGDRSRYTKLGRSVAMLGRVVNDEKASIRDVAYVLLDRLMQAFGAGQYKSLLARLDDNQRHNMATAVARGAPAVGPRSATERQALELSTQSGGTNGTTPFSSPAKKVPRVEDLSASTTALTSPPRVRTTPAPGPTAVARRLSDLGREDGAKADPEPHGALAFAPPRASSLARRSVASSASVPERQSVGRGRAAAARGSGVGHNGSKAAGEDFVALESLLPTKMESLTMILGLLNGDSTVLDLVRSHEWARRQEGVKKVFAMVQQWTPAQATRAMEYLLVYIRAHPSFREPTFQVFTLITQVFRVALAKVTTLSMAAGYAIVSGFTSRLAEPKNKPLVREVCSLVAGKLGQRFVVRHMLDTAATVKTPKLLQEVCEYVREAVQQQSDSEEAVREVVEAKGVLHFVKTVCSNFNSTGARQEAVLLLVALRRSPQVPTVAVERCVASLQPPLRALFERELNRPEGVTTIAGPSPPIRTSVALPAGAAAPTPPSPMQKRVRTVSQSTGPGTRTSVPASASPSRPSLQRRSLSDAEVSPNSHHRTSSTGGTGATTRLTNGHASSVRPLTRNSCSGGAALPGGLRSILHEINSGVDWRDRLNGVRHAEAFVAETPRPLPGHCAAALLKALQGRFEEANKNIVVDVLRLIPVVVDAARSEECRSALRQLTPGVLAMLGDQKAALREEARHVAFFAMSVVGLESLLPLLQRPLSSDSNACRQNVLEMMVKGFEQLPADATMPRAGMQLLTPAVIASIMDRLLEVRVVAEQVLGCMLGVVGEDTVMQSVQQLKPAEQQAVMPAVERQIEHRRRQLQEKQPEELQEQLPSVAKAVLSFPTVASGHLDNEESRCETPYQSAPSVSSPGTPRVASSGTATPRRWSAAHATCNVRPDTTTTRQNSKCAGTQESEVAMHARSTDQALAGAAAAQSRPLPASSSGPVTRSAVLPSRLSAASKTAMPAKVSPLSDAACTLIMTTDVSPLADDNEELYTIREILVGLRSATSEVALAMCNDFLRHLRAGVDCGTPEVVQVMVERLYENTQHFNSDLAHALIECLTAMFVTPRCAMRCHCQLLFRVMGAFFDCLLSERFSLHEPVIKALNATTLRLLEGCPTNDVFSALLSRLTTYSAAYLSSGQKTDLKFIQVTVKCVMRVDLAKVSPDTIILCCHEYLLQHPPSAFRNLDDLPIRTVKTVLQTTTKRHGVALLTTAENLVGPQNLVTHFIRACLELRNKAAKERGQNEEQAIEESRHEQRASQSPAPSSAKEKARSSPPTSSSITAATSGAATAAAARAVSPGTTPTTATASLTPKKVIFTPLRRKKRASQHADPNTTLTSFLSTTAASATGSSPGGLSSMSAPARTSRTPLKGCSRLQAAAVAGQGAPESPAPSTAAVAGSSTVMTKSGLNGRAHSSQTNVSAATPRDAKKDLTEIFAHIRNHVTSSSGIDELYTILRNAPLNSYEEAFRVQFNRCSEAFRLYIKRKLERKVEEDSSKPANFKLPPVLQNLS